MPEETATAPCGSTLGPQNTMEEEVPGADVLEEVIPSPPCDELYGQGGQNKARRTA